MKTTLYSLVLISGIAVARLSAQEPVPPPVAQYQWLSQPQLDQLLGPIALYPDPLIAQILPAATLPTQVVLADRYVTSGGDPNLIYQQPWDVSVQALARYPSVLKWLDDDLNRTTLLGQAFINQQQDVMDSVQRLRAAAQALGNLQSSPQQEVVSDSGEIEILPADPQVIYVPQYAPDTIFYRRGFGLSFGLGLPIGLWLNGDFDWHQHHLIVWDHAHPRPVNWWHERPTQREVVLRKQTTFWRPEAHRDARPVVTHDRGWANDPAGHPTRIIEHRPEVHPAPVPVHEPPHVVAPVVHPASAPRPAPVIVAHPAPARPAGGAFIGIHSSPDTRAFSERGRASTQPAVHATPPPRPAPSAPPSRPSGSPGKR